MSRTGTTLTLTIGTTLTLLLLASAATAGPLLEIGNPVFQGNRFSFDLLVVDPESVGGIPLVGIAAGAVLTGSGTSHLQAVAPEMRRSSAEWTPFFMARGQTYAWSDMAGVSQASNLGDPAVYGSQNLDLGSVNGTLQTFVMTDSLQRGFWIREGSQIVVARFVYQWDGVPLDPGSLVINVTSDLATGSGGEFVAPTLSPYFIVKNQSDVPIFGVTWNNLMGLPGFDLGVANNQLAVPEPATVALLGFGLASMFIRRRGRRS